MADATTNPTGSSRKMVVTGWVLSCLAVLFLVFDSSLKVLKVPAAVQGTAELGYSESIIAPLGVLLLLCTLLYAIPRTAVLGAVLLTGYLGGAVATQVRVGHPMLGYVLFPVYLGIFLWGGLYGRDARVRALLPLRGR